MRKYNTIANIVYWHYNDKTPQSQGKGLDFFWKRFQPHIGIASSYMGGFEVRDRRIIKENSNRMRRSVRPHKCIRRWTAIKPDDAEGELTTIGGRPTKTAP